VEFYLNRPTSRHGLVFNSETAVPLPSNWVPSRSHVNGDTCLAAGGAEIKFRPRGGSS
jgi:hypothetical protein